MPFDLSEARAMTRSLGKFRCDRMRSISVPTIPVAPTTATFSRLEVGTASVYFGLAKCARSRTLPPNGAEFHLGFRHYQQTRCPTFNTRTCPVGTATGEVPVEAVVACAGAARRGHAAVAGRRPRMPDERDAAPPGVGTARDAR